MGWTNYAGTRWAKGSVLVPLSIPRPLSAFYIKLFMPGPGISQLGSWPPDLEESRLDGARKPRPTKFTYYIQPGGAGSVPHFYRATFCGGIYEKFKTIMWLRLHLSASRMGSHWSLGWSVGRHPHQKLFMAFCYAKEGNTKYALIGFLLVTGALRVREGGELSKQVLVKMLF